MPTLANQIYDLLLKAEEEERESEAMEFRSLVTGYEEKYARQLRWMFRTQKKEVINKLKSVKDLADLYMFDTTVWEYNTKIMAEKYLKQSLNANGKRVFEDLQKIDEKIASAIVQKLDTGVETTFDMEYPESIEFIDNRSIQLAGEITATTEEYVRSTLVEAFKEGLTAAEVAAAINVCFDDKVRATTIARTEMIRAANYGTLAAYKQSGVVEYKEWLTAQDEKVCPFCGQIDRMQSSLNDNFLSVGASLTGSDGSIMTNNYVPVAAPPLHPRCRCTLLPVMKSFVSTKPAPTSGGQTIYPKNIDDTIESVRTGPAFAESAHSKWGKDEEAYFKGVFGTDKAGAGKILSDAIDKSSVYMAIDSNLFLREIVRKKGGTFKNSMETGKGTFKTIGAKRAKKESAMFGIEADLDDYESWPKYGFLSSEDAMKHKGIVGFGYGDTFVKFKKSKVGNRTTFTVGDSYNNNMTHYRYPDGPSGPEVTYIGQVAPVGKLTDPKPESLWTFNRYDPEAPILSKLHKSKINSIDDISAVTEYTEAQIYGKLSLEDVSEIIVESKKKAVVIEKALKKVGRTDIVVTPSEFDSRLQLIETKDWGKKAAKIRASVSPSDIDNLGDDYIKELSKSSGIKNYAKKHPMPPDVQTFVDIMDDRPLTIGEERDLLKVMAEIIPKKQDSGLPKAFWEDYRKTLSGFTDDVYNTKLLEGFAK